MPSVHLALFTGKWEWISDSPSLLPPCEGAVSYYSHFGRVAGFTSTAAGRRFRSVLEEHLHMLLWPTEQEEDRELSVRGEDGRLYHWILPSFFQLLQDLATRGGEFTIIFRTFGTDLPRLLSTLQRVLTQGSHPLFPNLPALRVSCCCCLQLLYPQLVSFHFNSQFSKTVLDHRFWIQWNHPQSFSASYS